MAGAAEALLEVCVDGGEAVAVVERQEEEGDDEVAEEEADAHLQVGHLGGSDIAGHTDEGDAGNAGANHAEGYQEPGRAAAGAEEGVVGAFTPREVGDQEENQEVCNDNNGGDDGIHGRGRRLFDK